MEKSIKSFQNFINEYWTSVAPGTVVVPGKWYKDGVNSKNYVNQNVTLPQVIDPMFEDNDLENALESIKTDKSLMDKISKEKDPFKIIDSIKEIIRLKRG